MQDTKGQVKYVGGSSHLDSIPVTFKYVDLAFRLTEKVNGAVSIKYLPPGDELDEDNLIGIWDDADVQVRIPMPVVLAGRSGPVGLPVIQGARLSPLRSAKGSHIAKASPDTRPGVWQEMYDEYSYSVQHCGGQGRAPRLKVFLFPASEEDLTPEQDLDGCDFFEGNRQAAISLQVQGLQPGSPHLLASNTWPEAVILLRTVKRPCC